MSDRSRKAELLKAMVKGVVDAADAEGLLDMGAPLDECDQEIALIAARLNALSVPSLPAVEALVFEVWQQQFGPLVENNEEAYRERLRVVAERLHEHSLRWRLTDRRREP